MKGAVTFQVQSKGAHKAKKKISGPSTKQILSTMGLNGPVTMISPPTGSIQFKGQGTNTGLSFNTASRQTGKATMPSGKNPRRQSQSRLEIFEAAHYPVMVQKKTYQLPMHKLKKRLKQHLANHSLHSLQESMILNS